jgi:rhodanese-related sulfurtransferase
VRNSQIEQITFQLKCGLFKNQIATIASPLQAPYYVYGTGDNEMLRNTIRKMALLLCVFIVLLTSGCSSAAQPAPSPTPTGEAQKSPTVDMKPIVRDFLAGLSADWNLVSSQDVAKSSPFIVDVRQPDEYSKGFIPGAINIPLRELARNLQALPGLDKDIVVVCDTGHRAAIGMAVLQMLGYKKAKTLDGGMQSWQATKLTIVTAPIPPRPSGQAPKVDPQVQAMLDYYLLHTLPYDWGVINAAGLTVDQKTPPSGAGEAQPETYDQGASLIIDVDTSAEFAKSILTGYQHAINISLWELPDELDQMSLGETINWA